MKRTLLWFPVLVILFDYLFWNQSPGLNVLVFTLLAESILFFLHPDSLKRWTCRIFAGAALATAFMVFVKGGGWALFANILSLLSLTTAIYFPALRSAFMVITQTTVSVIALPVTFIMSVVNSKPESRVARVLFNAGIIVGPICIAAVFYGLYLWGSPHFLQANSGIFKRIDLLFRDISAERIFFIVWELSVVLFFLVKPFVDLGPESNQEEILRRREKRSGLSMIGLKREYLSGLILLVLLNVLIAIVNIIDAQTLWFSFVVPENFSLKDFVHEGTWILSFCVIFSMTITLWLFRNNQNFYTKNKAMRILAYAWIAQNMVLTYSVFLRNYYYVAWHGLAYGRIFVYFFLFVVATALILSAVKIFCRQTAGFFVRRNSWIAFACILGASFVNWDALILRYNFQHRNVSQIDYGFYLDVSPDLLHECDLHQTEIEQQIAAHARNDVQWVNCPTNFWFELNWKQCEYVHEAPYMEWQSWTWNNRESLDWLKCIEPNHPWQWWRPDLPD